MSNSIYTITRIPPAKIDGIPQFSNCAAFYHNLEDAKKCVLNGGRDLCECYYTYIVIEEKYERYMSGPYHPTNELWYKWNQKKLNYFPCKKPKRFKSVVCFGIG
jgi:hypothetical protein